MAIEGIGDEATKSEKYDDAIAQYTFALSLDPQSKAGILVKRSRAKAATGVWRDALKDADVVWLFLGLFQALLTLTKAINEDPSYHWGYECRHAALHGMKLYDEAIEAVTSMLSVIKMSPDPKIRGTYLFSKHIWQVLTSYRNVRELHVTSADDCSH